MNSVQSSVPSFLSAECQRNRFAGRSLNDRCTRARAGAQRRVFVKLRDERSLPKFRQAPGHSLLGGDAGPPPALPRPAPDVAGSLRNPTLSPAGIVQRKDCHGTVSEVSRIWVSYEWRPVALAQGDCTLGEGGDSEAPR
jgi:hypothetical protein